MKKQILFLMMVLTGLTSLSMSGRKQQRQPTFVYSNGNIRSAIEDAAVYDPEGCGKQSLVYKKNMDIWWEIKAVKERIECKGLPLDLRRLEESMNLIIAEKPRRYARSAQGQLDENLRKIAATADQDVMNIFITAANAQRRYENIHGKISGNHNQSHPTLSSLRKEFGLI